MAWQAVIKKSKEVQKMMRGRASFGSSFQASLAGPLTASLGAVLIAAYVLAAVVFYKAGNR
jgi:hypothetical protein